MRIKGIFTVKLALIKKMNLENFSEQVFLASTRITIKSSNNTGTSIGTGFLFNIPFKDDTKRSALYLISNKHVFISSDNAIELNFNKAIKNRTSPDFGNLQKFETSDFSNLYTEHPDASIDLACVDVSKIKSNNFNTSFTNLHSGMLADFKEPELLPGMEIWFIGYPDNKFDIKNNLPLLRKGYISSLPKVDFNGQRKFVIDAQVFQGSSGSPVYTILNDSYKLIGVITETMVKHGKLQSMPTNQSVLGIQQYLGLGLVIKATVVKELLDLAFEKTMKDLKN